MKIPIPPARRHGASLLPILVALVAIEPPVIAANIWDGGGVDGKLSTLANWDDDALPNFAAGITLAGAVNPSVVNDVSNLTLGGLTFDPTADAFTLGGNPFTLTGPITNNSVAFQTISAPMVLGAATT